MKAPTDHLKTIQRRIDFLKARGHKNSFDLAEIGALEWALVNLQPKRPWVKLTDVNAVELWQLARHDIVEFARVIEAKLKEKNT